MWDQASNPFQIRTLCVRNTGVFNVGEGADAYGVFRSQGKRSFDLSFGSVLVPSLIEQQAMN